MSDLWHGDCLTEMGRIANGSADLILADLPYGTTACKWDTVIPFEPLWAHYRRVIKSNGAIVLTSSQPFSSALVMSNPEWFKYEWVWEKSIAGDFLNAGRRPLKAHESVLVFSPGTAANRARNGMTYNPQIDKTKPAYRRVEGDAPSGDVYREGRLHNFRPGTVRGRVGRMPRSVVRFANARGCHPTQKPVALVEYLIRTYTNSGELVLDNTMGSGTTGVAAINTGRRFIGIEKDADIYATAVKRIEAARVARSELLIPA